jgi:calcium channel MID1
MQLSPLQSRLAASLLASCLLVLLYLSLFSPHFALAADVNPPSPMFILEDLVERHLDEGISARQPEYEPDFALFDRSIIGRAPPGVVALANNVPQQLNLDPGTSQRFVFEKASLSGGQTAATLELRGESQDEARTLEERGPAGEEDEGLVRRQATKTVYFSANTCMQPQLKPDATTMDAPQLTMYVSTNPMNTMPGPGSNLNLQTWHVFTEGAIMVNVTTSDDVYIAISAPNVTSAFFDGGYNVQVAASIDDWYHSYEEQLDPDLIWVDSDVESALLITRNLTDRSDPEMMTALMTRQPYVMFAQNEQDQSINGVKFSYCGLQNYAQIAGTKNGKQTNMVTTDITRRGQSNLPSQRFYFSKLNASTNYLGILAANGNLGVTGANVVGGGGRVSRATTFATKAGWSILILNLKPHS